MQQLGDFASLHKQHQSGNEIFERKCKCSHTLNAPLLILQDFQAI